jgi:hypothetical protein
MRVNTVKTARVAASLFVFCLALNQLVRAQPSAIGVFVGASTSSMRIGDHGSSNTNRKSFTAGVNLRTRIPRLGPFAFNVLLSRKGFDVSEPTLHFTYLELPVLYQIELAGRNARVQPYFGLGIAFAALLSCHRSITGGIGPYEDNCGETQLQNGLPLTASRRWDVGQDYRFGLRFRAATGGVVLEARHARGMMDPGAVAGSSSSSRRHRFLALTLGYEWRLPGGS